MAARNGTESTIEHPSWAPEPTVEHWRCRAGCGELVGVGRTAIEHWREMSALLAARGERPLDTGAIVWCRPCEERLRAAANERKARARNEVTRLVNVLRASMDPTREQVVIARLRELGHPDIEGLVRQLGRSLERRFPGHDTLTWRDLKR